MDTTDLALCKLLLQNSRSPFRELAEKLGLSVAAVHSRIKAMRDEGIIRAFTARISPSALQASVHLVWGASRAASAEEVLERLRKNPHIYWVAFAGASFLYVGAYLRSSSELDACASSIVKEAEMVDPTVGLFAIGSGLPAAPVLDRLDCRILRAMHRDARRSVADVAGDIGVSARTVGRRLGRMTHEGKAEFSMEWYPDAANDIISMWHLDLRPAADRDKALFLLLNKYAPNILFAMSLSNLPRFLLAATWTSSMKELKDLYGRFRQEEAFERVIPNVLYTGYIFDTWRDELLMKWAGTPVRSG